MRMSQEEMKIGENQSISLQLAQMYWDQVLPQAVDISGGEPPFFESNGESNSGQAAE